MLPRLGRLLAAARRAVALLATRVRSPLTTRSGNRLTGR